MPTNPIHMLELKKHPPLQLGIAEWYRQFWKEHIISDKLSDASDRQDCKSSRKPVTAQCEMYTMQVLNYNASVDQLWSVELSSRAASCEQVIMYLAALLSASVTVCIKESVS